MCTEAFEPPASDRLGSMKRMIERAVNDLPQPDSPTKPIDSPAPIRNETSRTAGTVLPPTSTATDRFSTDNSGAASVMAVARTQVQSAGYLHTRRRVPESRLVVREKKIPGSDRD